MEFQIEEEEA
jgi:hypothetical protein